MSLRNNIIAILISIFLIGCISDLPIGMPLSSDSISSSKKVKYFVNEYIPSKRQFNVNDTLYNIQEVWSEKAWQIKNTNMEEAELGYQHFLVKFDEDFGSSISYLKSDYSINGIGYTKGQMRFKMSDAETKLDTIKLYFVIKKEHDTIPVLFVKRK